MARADLGVGAVDPFEGLEPRVSEEIAFERPAVTS
jgi:hypothetical protein